MVDSIPEQSFLENKVSPPRAAIKIATPDLILEDTTQINVEIMTDLIFENIGGQEIINIARGDLVNGQTINYSPIKNLLNINFKNNSKNIISLENTSETFFNNFPIKLDTHIPNVGTGPDGDSVYIDQTTGNLIVNVINMQPDEQVEVQIMVSGNLLDDTIY